MVRICAKRDFIYIVLFLAVTACVAFTRKDRFEGLRFNEPANYTRTVPGAGAGFEMVYIPGGEFDMGSPGTETGRLANEGPVHRVRVSPFWLCSTEVTWKLFEQYSIARDSTMLDAVTLASPKIQWQWIKRFSKWTEQRFYMWTHDLDAITRPSPYYGAYDHGMGRREKPAIGMSWLGAKTFCQWLTRKTGEKYRLPTEAEWEYAARAGSSSAYCFGDDPAGLDDYGWYEDNSDWETRKIGTSEPNAWGVYDMHGNVWEFCADAYDSLYYETLSKKK
ncbi:MAG: SUMF1/EgtB/PvdO family nonheme iron enzyme, partial [Gemmatimonadota bacterium]|nr:SUMF1/EgtB/PvdO family nonheme iron enzyme [Gemmatimonadota bacterium]